ncbi:hypothetical protein V6N13_142644 [Hibiscus sabdariffa]
MNDAAMEIPDSLEIHSGVLLPSLDRGPSGNLGGRPPDKVSALQSTTSHDRPISPRSDDLRRTAKKGRSLEVQMGVASDGSLPFGSIPEAPMSEFVGGSDSPGGLCATKEPGLPQSEGA